MFQALRGHRLALCDQLDGLTDEQWNAASLCDGWRVRDVLGHLVSVQVVPTWKFMMGVYSMKSFDRRADKIARDSERVHRGRWSISTPRWPSPSAVLRSWV